MKDYDDLWKDEINKKTKAIWKELRLQKWFWFLTFVFTVLWLFIIQERLNKIERYMETIKNEIHHRT